MAINVPSKFYLNGSTILKQKPLPDPEPSDQELYDDCKTIAAFKEVQSDIFSPCDFDYSEISELDYAANLTDSVFHTCRLRKIPRPPKQHVMSTRSKGKVKDKIFALYRSNLRSHFFCTLTFISSVSDPQGVKCLNKFLTSLRKRVGKFNYIWVAERQNKNTGNIHFHIIFDQRFDVIEINALWVIQQYNEGICHPNYTLEFIEKKRAEKEVQKHLSPCDVKKIKGVQHLSQYLTKYVTKNEDKFECRVWHCSRAVSRLFTSRVIGKHDFDDLGNPDVNYDVRHWKINDKPVRKIYQTQTIVTEHAVIRTVVNNRRYLPLMSYLEKVNMAILAGVYYEPKDFLITRDISVYLSLN